MILLCSDLPAPVLGGAMIAGDAATEAKTSVVSFDSR
jgi:hypothetical protein